MPAAESARPHCVALRASRALAAHDRETFRAELAGLLLPLSATPLGAPPRTPLPLPACGLLHTPQRRTR